MPQKLDRKQKQSPRWLIGVDEVGRGPLAGPFTLCALAVPFKGHAGYFKKLCPGIRDSKKLNEAAREEWNKTIRAEARAGKLHFVVVSLSAQTIDTKGMGNVSRLAVKRALEKLVAHLNAKGHLDLCDIRLDGSLFAPANFVVQQTIIKGDEHEPAISLASIVAKVHRDKYMKRLGKKYPAYGFEVHKGYGTTHHRKSIVSKGICPIHRKSFLSNIL